MWDHRSEVSTLSAGQLLTVPGSPYPEDWGRALLEVAGTSKEGPASTWRIKHYRAPTAVEQLDLVQQEQCCPLSLVQRFIIVLAPALLWHKVPL